MRELGGSATLASQHDATDHPLRSSQPNDHDKKNDVNMIFTDTYWLLFGSSTASFVLHVLIPQAQNAM